MSWTRRTKASMSRPGVHRARDYIHCHCQAHAQVFLFLADGSGMAMGSWSRSAPVFSAVGKLYVYSNTLFTSSSNAQYTV